MGKHALSELQGSFRDALEYNDRYRRASGLGKMRTVVFVAKRGPLAGIPQIGPETRSRTAAGKGRKDGMKPPMYKVTTWLHPWEMADLLRLKEMRGWTKSPGYLLKSLIAEAMPPRRLAARPQPVARRSVAA